MVAGLFEALLSAKWFVNIRLMGEVHLLERSGPEYLKGILLSRRSKNKKYSLRAFARDLNIPPSRLSEILSGKRTISRKQSLTFAEQLKLSPKEAAGIFGAEIRDPKLTGDQSYSYAEINEDFLRILVDWYHFALLNLMDTDDFVHDPFWMANRLNLPVSTVKEALGRLIRTRLLILAEGRFRKTKSNVATTDQVSSQALRRAHEQVIQLALKSLREDPPSVRDISSVSMALDVAKLGIAKQEIRRFRRRIARLMEGGKRNEVYNLNIQLVPVTGFSRRGTR